LRKNHNTAADITRLDKGGLVIGFFPDSSFEEGFVTLGRGDVLVTFTDGISEAMNSREEEFEERRLIDVLEAHEARTAAGLISEVLESVDRFTAGAQQHDDMTLVVLRVQ
jgi:sigma-B regulation protein RsbU (phosphoserine phosphatase)